MERLKLDRYELTTDSLLEMISMTLSTSAKHISLKSCQYVTDQGVLSLTSLRNLQYLDLSYCRITDKLATGLGCKY